MVLNTLTISPSSINEGIGREFVLFYEEYALRIDTQENIKLQIYEENNFWNGRSHDACRLQ